MANFLEATKITGQNEGGYANDVHDKGGLTYAGIASNYWPNWKGWSYVHEAMLKYNNGKTPFDVRNINSALKANPIVNQLVSGFYMANFWNVNQLSSINDSRVADNLYDCAVNQGTGRAAHILQDSINAIKGAGTVVSDGGVGPKTLTAANSIDPKILYDKINELRLESYKKNSDWNIYGKTWSARLVNY